MSRPGGAGGGRVPAVVIGGGVIGTAVLWELARRGIGGLLLEAEPDLCEGTSKANSAIVHTGFDAKPGTVEAAMLRRAAERWPSVVDELGVPFLAVGALMLAQTPEDAARLGSEVRANAERLGVRTELLGRDALREVAPYVAEDAVAALSIPGESVVDPFWLTRAFAEAAVAGGAEVRLGQRVVGLAVDDDRATVRLADGTAIETDQVFDCAGIRADEVARSAGDASFSVTPRKGQFLVSEETFGVDRIVLPIPGRMGKGMLVTPIVFGGLLLGPTAVDQDDKADRSTDPAERERILASCATLVPAVRDMVPIRQFAGVRHVSSTGDFVVRPSAAGDRLFLCAGIRSTGISTSPAVAEAAVERAARLRGWPAGWLGGSGDGSVRRALAPAAPPELEPRDVVCLCRSISRGEVEAACRQAIPPATLDAVKRRGGATFGDCQGNLCALDVAAIVASERGQPIETVERHLPGSWVVAAAAAVATAEVALPVVGPLPDGADVVVIGAGHAGSAAAAEMRDAGLAVVTLDWRTGWAAIGLVEDDGAVVVSAQSSAGAADITARAVVVATGAYVVPREHRTVAGPRPAGVVTAEFVERAIALGLRVASDAIVVGATRRAQSVAEALVDSGARVRLIDETPVEIRGDRRVEAVRVGDEWLDCDTLVLADRAIPQTFLLRGLGLVDGRPGVPAPVDAEGRLPTEGVWAAGCCVDADVDHAGCPASGRAVGRRVVEALASRSVEVRA